MSKELHISNCCKEYLFFKGEGKGFWCGKCKKEIFHTIIATTPKEIKALQEIRNKFNPK